ncbi:MAG: hypothetical protein ACK4GT_12445 [Pararhodobacter sp.]
MRWRPIKAALAAILLLCPAVAQADALARARIAALSGSERLQLFTLGQAMDTRRAPVAVTRAMRQALTRSGFYHEGPPALIDRHFGVSPVLAWDDNINGGYFSDTYDLFGLPFTVSPDNVARAGIVAGGRLDGSLRYALAEGRTIDLSAGAELAWSPRHEIGRGSARLEGCSRNHLSGWTFADFCASASGLRRELSSSHSVAVSAGLSRLFASADAAHELSVELEERRVSEGTQTGLALGWGAVWNRAVTQVSVGVATPIPGASATRLRVSARAGWLWQERPVSVSLWHLQSGGGMLLGVAREDRLTGIGLSVQARPGMNVELTHQVTTSTIALFSEARTGLSVRFQLGRR